MVPRPTFAPASPGVSSPPGQSAGRRVRRTAYPAAPKSRV
ncbi:hypothetical protein BRPE64_ACDS21620 [Caballeronia insecticola]|uniref:Uncharacterized protein n=1 Tax=Caballeronia insecticola TaxID=758793 RepID=R4WXT0_9BURK|nr:hypothetical protein BRPE64_ACDS21620 [Caballeronia insecticola]